jgi:hypothetical protein
LSVRSATGLNCPQHSTAIIGPRTIRGPSPPAWRFALRAHAAKSTQPLRPWPTFSLTIHDLRRPGAAENEPPHLCRPATTSRRRLRNSAPARSTVCDCDRQTRRDTELRDHVGRCRRRVPASATCSRSRATRTRGITGRRRGCPPRTGRALPCSWPPTLPGSGNSGDALTPRTFSPAPPMRNQPFPRAPGRTAARASPATFRPSTLSPYGERSAAAAHGRGREPAAVCGPQGKRARHGIFARTGDGAIDRDVTTGAHAVARTDQQNRKSSVCPTFNHYQRRRQLHP